VQRVEEEEEEEEAAAGRLALARRGGVEVTRHFDTGCWFQMMKTGCRQCQTLATGGQVVFPMVLLVFELCTPRHITERH
jgi:hypothetical protein